MGLFGGLFGGGGGNFFDRLSQGAAGAQAALAGDYGALSHMQQQRRRLQAEQEAAMAEAEAEQRARDEQVWGLKESGMGNPLISALTGADASQVLRERMSPYSQAEGSLRVNPSMTGGEDERFVHQNTEEIRWITPPDGGAPFAVDYQGRPLAAGIDIRSPLFGGQQGQQQPTQPGQPQQPGATPTAAAGDFPSRMGATFAQAGLPAPVIAGILGNAHHESGGQWNAATGDGGTAHGAFQWRNERVQNFQRLVGVHPSEASPEQTAQFVLWELQNPQAAGMTQGQVQAILRAPTPEAAARLFSQHYERPNARLAHDNRRAALANQYAGGTQTAQANVPGAPGQRTMQDMAGNNSIVIPRRPPEQFNYNPDGSIAPIPGSTPDYQRIREGRQDVGQVVQQYRSDPIVQQWQTARVATMQLQNLGQSGSPADDVAMIFSFMRALDPNSTVREGEFATAQNTAGIPERIRNYYNQAKRGTLLGEQQRREFVNTAGRLYTERSRVYNEHANSYRTQLRSMGIENPNEFVPVAMAPVTADRQRRERQQQRQNQPVDPNDVMEGVNSAIEQMIPGQPQRFRIRRRRPL